MPRKQIDFTDEQWTLIERVADATDITPTGVVKRAVRHGIAVVIEGEQITIPGVNGDTPPTPQS